MAVLKYVIGEKLLLFAKLEKHLLDITLMLFERLKLVPNIVTSFRSVLLVRLFDTHVVYARNIIRQFKILNLLGAHDFAVILDGQGLAKIRPMLLIIFKLIRVLRLHRCRDCAFFVFAVLALFSGIRFLGLLVFELRRHLLQIQVFFTV